jgi:Fe2+ or Zn2+ uptake regulation protein
MQSKEHPTVEMIFNALLPEMPSLSRTTVYNTVELFKEVGLVQVLDFGRGVLRYDADLSPHSHFECERCGAVYDLDISLKIFQRRCLGDSKCIRRIFMFLGFVLIAKKMRRINFAKC